MNRKRAQKLASTKLPQIEELKTLREHLAMLRNCDTILCAAVHGNGGILRIPEKALDGAPKRIEIAREKGCLVLRSVYPKPTPAPAPAIPEIPEGPFTAEPPGDRPCGGVLGSTSCQDCPETVCVWDDRKGGQPGGISDDATPCNPCSCESPAGAPCEGQTGGRECPVVEGP